MKQQSPPCAGAALQRLRLLIGAFLLCSMLPIVLLLAKVYAQLEQESLFQYRAQAEETADRIETRLLDLLREEQQRPFAEYSFFNLLDNPLLPAKGLTLSPLAELPRPTGKWRRHPALPDISDTAPAKHRIAVQRRGPAGGPGPMAGGCHRGGTRRHHPRWPVDILPARRQADRPGATAAQFHFGGQPRTQNTADFHPDVRGNAQIGLDQGRGTKDVLLRLYFFRKRNGCHGSSPMYCNCRAWRMAPQKPN